MNGGGRLVDPLALASTVSCTDSELLQFFDGVRGSVNAGKFFNKYIEYYNTE